MSTQAFSYSAFLRGPSDVLPSLERGDDVRLDRRDDAPIFLVPAERYEARSEGMSFAARTLARLAKENPSEAAELLGEELPWLHWLPEDERRECVRDVIADFSAGADTGTLEPFARTIREWKHTAEVWSNPNLAGRLLGDLPGDGPAIERPSKR